MAKELLGLEDSFQEISSLPIAKYVLIPKNADISKFQSKIESLGFPIWIKLDSGEHKTKIKAIEQCCNFEQVEKVHKSLKKRFPDKRFIVQESISGAEIIAGINLDKVFGKTLLIGSGGSLAETIKDISFRVCPVDKTEILSALQELKIFPVLKEKNYNINKLVDLIKKFSDLKIEEADLNPIIVNEKSAVVVDSRVRI